MALILGVSTGSVIYLDDVPLQVVRADKGNTHMSLSLDGGPTFVVSDIEATEVMANVFVSVGKAAQQDRHDNIIPRIVIEAPRSVVILRSELYERQKQTS